MGDDAYGRALEQALSGMTAGPMPLHAIVAAFLTASGQMIAPEEIPGLILDSDPNDPGRVRFHLRLAEWDAAKDMAWAAGTAPRTGERRALILSRLGLDAGAAARVDEVFPPVFDRTTVIADPQWAPWYDEDRRRAHHFYWDGYRRVLERRLDPDAVASIDSATTEIVGRLADPSGSRPYQSKGLVVGHVQSGKTANFTGVIAKAVDAGYRLIIVLTGTVEILRSQTQRRLDMELIGRENILGGIDPEDRDLIAEVDYAGSDGIDSNGSAFVTGGQVLIGGQAGAMDGAVDANGESTLVGVTGSPGVAEGDTVTVTSADGTSRQLTSTVSADHTTVLGLTEGTQYTVSTTSGGSATNTASALSSGMGGGPGPGGPGGAGQAPGGQGGPGQAPPDGGQGGPGQAPDGARATGAAPGASSSGGQ